ncbi:hypothetical protein CLOM_g18685 [Closterium sp. NIES-68]|nr:hypothetical protein CLOM_g18685 [Closterium sp. NIES-68]
MHGCPKELVSHVLPFKLPEDEQCQDLWAPPRVVRGFVNGFIDTFLGKDFAAVHLRRSDFASYIDTNKDSRNPAYLPVVSVAQFTVGRLRGTGVSAVYLATDASPSEIQLLERLLLELDPSSPFILVRLPTFHKGSSEYQQFPWVRSFQQSDSHESGILRAIAEKNICAAARYFIGTPRSTFSSDIFRMREERNVRSSIDTFIGQPKI